jgi:hypothetical protein
MVHAQAVLARPLMSKVEAGGGESSYGAVPGLHDCTKTAKMVELQTSACESPGSVHRSRLLASPCHVGRPMQATPE